MKAATVPIFSESYFDNAKARESSNINTEFVDLVAFHPLKHSPSWFQPRVEMQQLGPIRDRLS